MKIRNLIITDTNGEEHYVEQSQSFHDEEGYPTTTIFTTVFGEKITIRTELSDIVAGSYRGEVK